MENLLLRGERVQQNCIHRTVNIPHTKIHHTHLSLHALMIYRGTFIAAWATRFFCTSRRWSGRRRAVSPKSARPRAGKSGHSLAPFSTPWLSSRLSVIYRVVVQIHCYGCVCVSWWQIYTKSSQLIFHANMPSTWANKSTVRARIKPFKYGFVFEMGLLINYYCLFG